jgi:hypothetical protein
LRRDELTPFVRLRVPGDDCVAEVARWRADDDATWQRGDFLVSPRAQVGQIVDVYVRERTSANPAMLRHIAHCLAQHCEVSWANAPDAVSRELWRSIASYGLRVFGLIAKPGRQPLLRPISLSDAEPGHVGYALVANDQARALERATMLAAKIEDDTRQRELRATIALAAETARTRPTEPRLMFLGATYLVDAEGLEVPLAEFDGAWCFFSEDEVVWYLLEHKTRRRAQSDLTKKFGHLCIAPILVDIASDEVKGKVSVAMVRWPTATQ